MAGHIPPILVFVRGVGTLGSVSHFEIHSPFTDKLSPVTSGGLEA
jgi:hypothetical protein